MEEYLIRPGRKKKDVERRLVPSIAQYRHKRVIEISDVAKQIVTINQ